MRASLCAAAVMAFGAPEFGSHAAIKIAEGTLAVMQGLGGHAERECGAALHLARRDEKHFPPADVVVRA
jgi:hypothetical protein